MQQNSVHIVFTKCNLYTKAAEQGAEYCIFTRLNGSIVLFLASFLEITQPFETYGWKEGSKQPEACCWSLTIWVKNNRVTNKTFQRKIKELFYTGTNSPLLQMCNVSDLQWQILLKDETSWVMYIPFYNPLVLPHGK